MIKPSSLPRFAAVALLIMGALSLTACGHSPDPNAKLVVMPCLAFTLDDASKLFGADLKAYKLSGDGAPVKVCEYTDDKGTNYALLKLQSSADIKDPVADLNADAEQNKALFKNNIRPIVIHPADGFGSGAFYLDNTTGPDSSSVQLHVIENGYKVLAQVNNPKDFDTGEKQAAAMVKQTFANIQSGTASQAL